MPCICGRSVRNLVRKSDKKSCKVRYCLCGFCNHCHVGGFYPQSLSWYTKKNFLIKNQILLPRELNQSHGGHGWIPDCDNCR